MGRLVPEFMERLERALAACEADGVTMRVYCTDRSPSEQARLWRQSRARAEIDAALRHLRDGGAPWLAEILASVGPQHGKPVTNALPGLSWHQWGLAADCFWEVDGRAVWSVGGHNNGYKVLAMRAKIEGLTPGGYWVQKDWPHVQGPPDNSGPDRTRTLAQINDEMKERWGG